MTGSPPDPADLDPTALHRAAGRLPAGARAVLWLVLFGRWSYGEVEDFLGIERSVLRTLLRYRHALLAEVLGAGWGRAPRGRTTTN